MQISIYYKIKTEILYMVTVIKIDLSEKSCLSQGDPVRASRKVSVCMGGLTGCIVNMCGKFTIEVAPSS